MLLTSILGVYTSIQSSFRQRFTQFKRDRTVQWQPDEVQGYVGQAIYRLPNREIHAYEEMYMLSH